MPGIKIAGVQMDVNLGEMDDNLAAMLRFAKTAVENGAQLIVFPECTLTGYCFDSMKEAKNFGQNAEGTYTGSLIEFCKLNQVAMVYGFLEYNPAGGLFNSLAMVGQGGLLATYRKVHLPCLGVDRFTTPGDRPFEVHTIKEFGDSDLRVGLNICYDCSFPESARVLSLAGADVIILPTNWPPGAGCTADIVPNARALENHVYFVAVNRVGTERGFEFVGKSKICEPNGANMTFADHDREEIIYAEIDPSLARNKALVRVPKLHEIHRTKDRRPEFYRSIVD